MQVEYFGLDLLDLFLSKTQVVEGNARKRLALSVSLLGPFELQLATVEFGANRLRILEFGLLVRNILA